MKRLSCLIGTIVLASMMLTACGDKAVTYDSTSMDITRIDVDSYISELGQYSGLTVEADKKMVITDATVDQYIAYVLENTGIEGEKVEVDRAIIEGDIVNIDYVGTKDGVAFDGGTGTYDLTIGSGQFIPGFESGLVGHNKGEVVVLPLTFPENYGKEELAGQDVVFEVTINTVSEQKPVEITDEYVSGLGIDGVTDVASFKQYIKTSLDNNAENTYINGKRDALLNAIYDNTTFTEEDLPANLLEYYTQQTTLEDRNAAESYGTTLDEYVQVMYDETYDEYMAAAKETAIVKLRDVIVCQKIAMIEGITISDDEVEKRLVENANQYGYESVDAFLEVISKEDFRNYLIELEVIDTLLEKTTVIEKDDSAETESAE